jgi:hypothetical protein
MPKCSSKITTTFPVLLENWELSVAVLLLGIVMKHSLLMMLKTALPSSSE